MTSEEVRVHRHRPKDRRAQIAATSAAAFAELGYHQVSITDIGARLGITSAALYRHYPSKYAIFAAELFRLAEVTVAAVTLPPQAQQWTPQQRLGHALEAIVAGTIANRPTVALARREARYLDPPDRATLDDRFATATAMLSELVAGVRPELSARECGVRVIAMFSAVSSIGDHRVGLSAKSISALLDSLCWAIVETDLPEPESISDRPGTEVASPLKHELMLRQAIHLFYERGYANVSVEDIVLAADLQSASALYRYFRSKGDLLTTAFHRVTDRMVAIIGPTIAESSCPAEALSKIVTYYASEALTERELAYVYYAEAGHLPVDERTPVRTVRRLIVDQWAALLIAARDELSPAEAHILVHAALGLVVDFGRVYGDDEKLCPQRWVIWLMQIALFWESPARWHKLP
ncbi:TetR/AcrR family transcriptional regulator [Nocardia sp. NPDC056000]|uniref:TetR/AcrR family transcriptional regulator n=1 Tax=Nocardia sp. NPDC056000 TaxID=3345674 RepID=UPI0035D635CF